MHAKTDGSVTGEINIAAKKVATIYLVTLLFFRRLDFLRIAALRHVSIRRNLQLGAAIILIDRSAGFQPK
jgi:hypothetical protein